MSANHTDDYPGIALAFATALTKRDYGAAYAMTSRDYRHGISLETMQASFEQLVPAEFGPVTSVDAGLTMESWPDKQSGDVGWAYVSIGGDVYSEAITVVVTSEDGALKVRDAEFGRP